jgi:hypothetical protein
VCERGRERERERGRERERKNEDTKNDEKNSMLAMLYHAVPCYAMLCCVLCCKALQNAPLPHPFPQPSEKQKQKNTLPEPSNSNTDISHTSFPPLSSSRLEPPLLAAHAHGILALAAQEIAPVFEGAGAFLVCR